LVAIRKNSKVPKGSVLKRGDLFGNAQRTNQFGWDLLLSRLPKQGRCNQNIHLTNGHSVRTQGVVIYFRDRPSEQSQTDGDTLICYQRGLYPYRVIGSRH